MYEGRSIHRVCFLLMVRRPPGSTRTDTLCPYPTLCRSQRILPAAGDVDGMPGDLQHFDEEAGDVGLVVDHQHAAAGDGPRRGGGLRRRGRLRSEEHTSELQSLMRISYAAFCLKKKKDHT